MLSIHLTLSRMLRNAVSGGEKGIGLQSEETVIMQDSNRSKKA